MKLFALLGACCCLLHAEGRPAPEFTFTVPPGGQRIVSQLRGKVIAFEFAYSTCVPCQAAAERLQKLAAEFSAQGFEAYAIAFDVNANVMVENNTVGGSGGFALAWASAKDVRSFLGYAPAERISVPQIVLIDRSGQIQYQTSAVGSDPLRQDAEVRTKITQLLAPPPSPAAKPATVTRGKGRRK